MAISVNCDSCGKLYSLKTETAGQMFVCQSCGSQVNIPSGNQLTANPPQGGQAQTQRVPVHPDPISVATNPTAKKKIIIFAGVGCGVMMLLPVLLVLGFFLYTLYMTLTIKSTLQKATTNVQTTSQVFSPRSEIRSAISNLESKFKAALLANIQHDRIQESEGTSPKFSSNVSRGILQWNGRGIEFTRLAVEIVDHNFDTADGLGEIVFDVDYSYLFDDGVSGGLDKRYTVSFLVENDGFVLDKVLKAERSRHKKEFASAKIYSHEKDPTIEVLLGDFIQF